MTLPSTLVIYLPYPGSSSCLSWPVYLTICLPCPLAVVSFNASPPPIFAQPRVSCPPCIPHCLFYHSRRCAPPASSRVIRHTFPTVYPASSVRASPNPVWHRFWYFQRSSVAWFLRSSLRGTTHLGRILGHQYQHAHFLFRSSPRETCRSFSSLFFSVNFL